MNTEELKRLAEAATPGPWAAAISSNMVNRVCATFETICETGKNIDDALYIAAANPAAILTMIQQRDELLAALKKAHQWFADGDDDRRADELHETITKAEAQS